MNVPVLITYPARRFRAGVSIWHHPKHGLRYAELKLNFRLACDHSHADRDKRAQSLHIRRGNRTPNPCDKHGIRRFRCGYLPICTRSLGSEGIGELRTRHPQAHVARGGR